MPNSRHVALGTISFTVCFAAWGLISAFAPRFRELLPSLTPSQTALLVAVPVLLGSLARIPMGMLTDRFGGRVVFTVLMAAVAVPVLARPAAVQLSGLLVVALSCSGWPALRSRSAWATSRAGLRRSGRAARSGVYGLGNIGQSAAVFLGPVLAARVGMPAVFRGVAVLLVLWAVVFALLARNAPRAGARRKGLGDMLEVLTRENALAWVLSAFYFLTFGGFVAFSIYLPTLLKDEFGLTPADAGFRTAGFVVLATLLRPLGGWLSDRIGGARVLSAVFCGVVPFALLLAWPADAAVHRRRAGLRGAARPRQRRGVQAGAAVLSRPDRHRHRPGGRHGRPGRLLPAAAAGILPRHVLGVIWPGFLLLAVTPLAALVGQPPGLRAAPAGPRSRAARRPAPHRRPLARRRLGHAVDRRCWWPRSWSARAICRTSTRPWSSTPSPWSSPPGAWSTTTTSGSRSRPRASTGIAAGSCCRREGCLRSLGPRSCRWPSRTWPRRRFIRAPLAPALVDAPVPLLGLPAGRGHHVPAGLRLDLTSARCPTTR